MLNELQQLSDEEQSDMKNLLLMGQVQEGFADIFLAQGKIQEALSHLVQSMTQLETIEEKPLHILVRVYEKLAKCFEKLDQKFESEKYSQKAGQIRTELIKEEIIQKFSQLGYKISTNVTPLETEATPIDILLEKGSFVFKKRIAIWFVLDEEEVSLLPIKGYSGFAKRRYIFLLSTPTIMSAQGAKIINSIDQIQPF